MASLTGNLPEQQWTPQPIGGAKQTTLFEGLADTASGIMRAFDNAQGSTRKTQSADDNPVLDEEAMRIFEDKTGLRIGDPGYNDIQFAKKLETAKKNGSISSALYDVRMQGTIANLMRENPSNAREIMADAYNLHGVKDNLFREAALAEEADKRARDREDTTLKSFLAEATTTGMWNGLDENEGMRIGIESFRRKAGLAADKAAYEAEAAALAAGKEKAKPVLEELRRKMQNNLLGTVDQTLGAAMNTLSDLTGAALDSTQRQEIIQRELAMAQLGINQLEANGNLFMDSFTREYTVNGIKSSTGFEQKERDEFKTKLNGYRSMLTDLQNMDSEQQKRVIDSFANNATISAQKQFPSLFAFNKVIGGSFAQTFQILADPEAIGLDPEITQALLKKGAEGIDQWTKTSLQAIDDMTNAGSLPVTSPDQSVSQAAFIQAHQITQTTGALLAKGNFKGPTDQKAAADAYGKYMEMMLYGTSRYYTPANITAENATSAVQSLFNAKTLEHLDGFKKGGGDPKLVDLFESRLPITASTFIEGLKQRGNIVFDDATGKFIPNAQFGLFQAGEDANARQTANAANSLLDFIDQANVRKPVIDPTLLKESGRTLRQLLGSENGLDDVIKTVAARAKAKLEEDSNNYFKRAASGLTDPTKNMMGGINTNPFNESKLTYSGNAVRGGENPFDSEAAWAQYESELRSDESGGDNNIRPKNKDGTLASSALGPHQFITSTWLQFAQDEPWAQGLSREEILAKRTDPAISEEILKQFTAENSDQMMEALGRKPLKEELRMAHFTGAEGAIAVLQANPSMPIDKLLDSAKGLEKGDVNFRMYYKGVDKEGKPIPRTAEEFMKMFGMTH